MHHAERDAYGIAALVVGLVVSEKATDNGNRDIILRNAEDAVVAETTLTQSFPEPSPPEPWSITLRVTEGPHLGKVFTFAQHDTFLVGRSRKAHFCLPKRDPYFSRMHFLIEVNPPLCRLVDLKSKSGTLVNGEKVTNTELKDGDEIRGGSTVMKVEIHAPVTESARALADPVDLLD